MSPFFANSGFHPCYHFELDISVDAAEEGKSQTEAERLELINELA